MINYRYLLESGAPDGYSLEDASGVLLLEESNPVTADQNLTMRDQPPTRGRQRGFIDTSQSLLIALTMVAATTSVVRPAVISNPVLKKKDQQVEQYENRVVLVQVDAPKVGIYFPDFAPKKHDQQVEQLINEVIRTDSANRGPLFNDPARKKRDQQVELIASRAILDVSAPFSPERIGTFEPKRHYQQIEQQPNYFAFLNLLEKPFAPEHVGFYEAKRHYQQIEQQPNPFAYNAILAAPFEPIDYPQTGQAKRDAQDYQQAAIAITAKPFASGEWPLASLKKRDQWPLFETSELPAPFQILERPFTPVEFPLTGTARRDAQDWVQASIAITAMPFASADLGYYAAKDEYQQVDPQPNPLAFSGTLERPFVLAQWPEFQKKRDQWPLFETSEFPAPFQILEEPFVPVDFPHTGQARRDAQDYQQRSLDLVAMPFPSWDVGYYERKDEYQQIEQQPNVFAYNDLLEAPFIPEAFENPYAKKPDAQDFIAFYFDAAGAFVPFTPVIWPEFQKKRDQWPLFETSELPAPFQILEEPFVPVEFPQTGQAKRDAQDYQQRSLDLVAMPFPSWDVGYYERKDEYQQVDPQPNPLAFSGTLERPFIAITWPEFQKKRDQWPLFEASEFPAPFQILEEPFVPVDFPQTGQAKRDAQDYTQAAIALTAMPFPSGEWPLAAQKKRDQWPLFETSELPAPFGILEEPFIPVMWPEYERLPSYQEEQQPNPFAFRGTLERPFIPIEYPQTGQARRDAQDYFQRSLDLVAMPFASADLGYYAAKAEYRQVEQQPNVFAYNNALAAPFVPCDFPQPDPPRFRAVAQDYVLFFFDESNAFNPFVPVEFPQTGQSKRDAQDHVWFYFDGANAFIPFTPVTWPEFEPKQDHQDYQQRSLDLVAMPFPSADLGYYAVKDEYQQVEQQPNVFAYNNLLEAPFIPEAFENPARKKRDAQDFILFYFDAANAFNPFVPYDFPQTGQAKRDAQDHQWYYFDGANAFYPFIPVETAQDARRLHAAPVEIYINVSALYAAAGVPFTPAIFETPQVRFEAQYFTGGSLSLTAMPFPSAELAQAPYARPQQQVELFQYVLALQIGNPFIPTENGWYEAKTQEHTVDEPQNLHPLHDVPVFDPFVPVDFPQTGQTKHDYEQQQYPSFTALLLSRHPGKAFCVPAHNRTYIVEPQPRTYCVEAVDRVYIVVENARIYYAEPVDRVYDPED